jgi:hypothetical protein
VVSPGFGGESEDGGAFGNNKFRLWHRNIVRSRIIKSTDKIFLSKAKFHDIIIDCEIIL